MEGAWQPAVPPCQRSRQLQTALESSLESDFRFAGIVCLQKPTSKNYVTRWVYGSHGMSTPAKHDETDDIWGRKLSKHAWRMVVVGDGLGKESTFWSELRGPALEKGA